MVAAHASLVNVVLRSSPSCLPATLPDIPARVRRLRRIQPMDSGRMAADWRRTNAYVAALSLPVMEPRSAAANGRVLPAASGRSPVVRSDGAERGHSPRVRCSNPTAYGATSRPKLKAPNVDFRVLP